MVKAKQVFIIMGIGIIILILTTIFTGDMKVNNFIIFFSGGLLGLAVGRNESKKEGNN
ncbi:hypothetical protein V7114_24845 [Neobacillus niacini]|uniref:hypothetical protein n=1 Tax=Neobacillus niacini TaxID=86668 RepID=UPI002FFF51BB